MEYKSILKEDMAQLEMALRGDMSSMEMSLRRDMSSMETNLRDEIKDSKIDTIKWMAGIFLALALMILGLYIKK